MNWLRSEDLKEEKVVTTSLVHYSGSWLLWSKLLGNCMLSVKS